TFEKSSPSYTNTTISSSGTTTLGSMEVSIEKAAQSKLEVLPIVNYENTRKHQPLTSTTKRVSDNNDMGSSNNLNNVDSSNNNAISSGTDLLNKTNRDEWRKERRRLRQQQQQLQQLAFKRQRQDT